MLTTVEYLKNPVLIVRFGLNHTTKTPYWKSVTAEKIGDDHLIIKGYDQNIDPTDFTDVMVRLYQENFRTVEFERLGPPHRTIYLTLGPNGVLHMKSHIHSVKEAHGSDNKLNVETVMAHAEAAKQKYISGEEILLGLYEIIQHDGSILTIFHHIAADGIDRPDNHGHGKS